MSSRGTRKRTKQHTCPICGLAAALGEASFPFCSLHCKSVDLYNWLTGEYQLPGLDLEEEETSASESVILFD